MCRMWLCLMHGSHQDNRHLFWREHLKSISREPPTHSISLEPPCNILPCGALSSCSCTLWSSACRLVTFLILTCWFFVDLCRISLTSSIPSSGTFKRLFTWLKYSCNSNPLSCKCFCKIYVGEPFCMVFRGKKTILTYHKSVAMETDWAIVKLTNHLTVGGACASRRLITISGTILKDRTISDKKKK